MSTSTTSEDHRADGYLHVRSPLEARVLVGLRVSVHFPDTRWHGQTVQVHALRGTLWATSAGFIQWTHDRVRVRTVVA